MWLIINENYCKLNPYFLDLYYHWGKTFSLTCGGCQKPCWYLNASRPIRLSLHCSKPTSWLDDKQRDSFVIQSSLLLPGQIKADLIVGVAERPYSSFQHTWYILLDVDMLMLSMMECSHSVCRDSIVMPSPCPSRCAVWWPWKNIMRTTCFRNILLWDPNFQFLQGDLRVFSCCFMPALLALT